MIRQVLLALLFALSLLPCAQAQWYLPEDRRPLVDLVPAPPRDDSIAGRADLATLIQVQADRTPEQIKRAERVANQTVTSFAQPVLGEWFVPKNFPKTVALFAQITKQSQTIVDDQVKKRWNRTRPYIQWPEVKPVVGRPDNTSYPSGHSAAAALWGTILAAAFPEKAEQFKAQIREVTWCRVLGGVHYPTDTVAGEMLGTAIAEAMLKSPHMPAALAVMREEIGAFQKAMEKPAAHAPLGQ
jgi:acid phosphatase (class A)